MRFPHLAFTWHVLRDLMLLFLGVCMVIVLLHVNDRLGQVEDFTLENRVAVCRLTRAMGLPFDPDGPCSVPEVRRRLEELANAYGG